jgi:uncharacterized membrane protein YgdD (TMEM256/DUF423 family)
MNASGSISRLFFATGAFSAGIGVAAGAFGAHGLKDVLTPDMHSIFETAVRYQMYHSLGLIAAGWGVNQWGGENPGGFRLAGWLFVVGIVLFSGSLYALSITGQRWLGAITPVGGLAFIIGWVMLAWTVGSTLIPRQGEK